MREIKFRAWDKDEERMLTQEEMTEIGGFYYNFGVDPDTSEFVLMQYTGLLDRKGKEICDGDIVKGKEEGMLIVHWSTGSWGVGSYCFCNFLHLHNEKVKIIGNIYKNKNLLHEKDIKKLAKLKIL